MQWFKRISHLNGLKCQDRRKFSNGHCDSHSVTNVIQYNISQHQGPTHIQYKFQPNIPSYFGEMDLSARAAVIFCRVDFNFQTVIVT